MRGGREKPFIASSIRTVDDQTTAACGRISPSSTKERERLIHFRRWLARPPARPRTKVGELLARPLSVLTPRGRHESRTRAPWTALARRRAAGTARTASRGEGTTRQWPRPHHSPSAARVLADC